MLIIDHLFVEGAALARGGWSAPPFAPRPIYFNLRHELADSQPAGDTRRYSLLVALDDLFTVFRQLDTAVGAALARVSRRRVISSSTAALALVLLLGNPVKAQIVSGPVARPQIAMYIVSDRTSSVPSSEFTAYLTNIVPTMVLPMVATGDEVFSLTIPQGRVEYLKLDHARLSHLTDFYKNQIVPLIPVKPNSAPRIGLISALSSIGWVGPVSDRLGRDVKPVLVILTDGEPAGAQQPVRETVPEYAHRIFFIGVHPNHTAALMSFLDRNHLTGNVDLIAPFDGWQSYASVFSNKVGRQPNTQLILSLEVRK